MALFEGCATSNLGEPRSAAQAWQHAVERKDAKAVYGMLDEQSRRVVTLDEVQALLDRDATDISRHVQSARASRAPVELRANVSLTGGQDVSLDGGVDGYGIDDVNALMGFAVTPYDALSGLRQALEQPDYRLLLQLLSPQAREQVESRRKALVEALSDLAAVDVVVQGDEAVANTADGHRVELELEAGTWRIRNFE